MRPFEGADKSYVVLVVFFAFVFMCYGILILLLNLFGFLFLLFLIENVVWISREGVRFHGVGFRLTYKLKNSTSHGESVATLSPKTTLEVVSGVAWTCGLQAQFWRSA